MESKTKKPSRANVAAVYKYLRQRRVPARIRTEALKLHGFCPSALRVNRRHQKSSVPTEMPRTLEISKSTSSYLHESVKMARRHWQTNGQPLANDGSTGQRYLIKLACRWFLQLQTRRSSGAVNIILINLRIVTLGIAILAHIPPLIIVILRVTLDADTFPLIIVSDELPTLILHFNSGSSSNKRLAARISRLIFLWSSFSSFIDMNRLPLRSFGISGSAPPLPVSGLRLEKLLGVVCLELRNGLT